jgi:hypothetical protein
VRAEKEFLAIRLLFFRQPDETDKLQRAEARSSWKAIPDVRTLRQGTDSSGVEGNPAIRADPETAQGAPDWTSQP